MIEVRHAQGHYPVYFRPWHEAQASLPDNAIVLVDENVWQLYEGAIGNLAPKIVVPSGEASKSFSQFERVHRNLAELGANRRTTLVAIGGGVLGDLVGFVAATYMRGVPYVQVPTTLLAMIDSSVGGKVAIDIPEGKNLVGAFYPPVRVEIDPLFLGTLPPRHIANGVAEGIKYAYIANCEAPKPHEAIPAAWIEACVRTKAQIVEADEFETLGIRATLNFGHTVGHALEALMQYENLLHGEAVGIGMVLETKIAERMHLAEKGLADQIAADLRLWGLPCSLNELPKFEADKWIRVMRRDKKNLDQAIHMSLVHARGACKLTPVEPNVIVEVLQER